MTDPPPDAADLAVGEHLRALLRDPAARPALATFAERTLGALERHDVALHGDLVRTLAIYLACNGNASRAATALFLHRNSLAYRLQRISLILRRDLDAAGTRLELALALAIRAIP